MYIKLWCVGLCVFFSHCICKCRYYFYFIASQITANKICNSFIDTSLCCPFYSGHLPEYSEPGVLSTHTPTLSDTFPYYIIIISILTLQESVSTSCIQLYHILCARGHCLYTNAYTSGTSTIFSGLTSSLSSRFRMNL